MNLIENWWLVFRHAWSVRLILIGCALNAGAIVLPLMVEAIPRGWLIAYGIVTFLVILAAGLSRFIHQDKVRGDDGDQ